MSIKMCNTIHIVERYGNNNSTIMDEEISDIQDFCKEYNIYTVKEEDCTSDTLIIALGGDGTVMTACRIAAKSRSLVIGVNHGTLGFLADVNASGQIVTLLEELIADGDAFRKQQRHLLSSEITTANTQVNSSMFAVNDFYICSRNGQAIDYALEIDGKPAAQHTADGVIISSPTGSTAYSLAAGGAIMMPTMKAMQVIPVAPHMLTSRPLIVGERHEVSIKVKADKDIVIRCDGIDVECAPHDDEYIIKVRIGKRSVSLLKYKDSQHNFFDVMKEKLYYGRRGRN